VCVYKYMLVFAPPIHRFQVLPHLIYSACVMNPPFTIVCLLLTVLFVSVPTEMMLCFNSAKLCSQRGSGQRGMKPCEMVSRCGSENMKEDE
jgi:hypothetical protein